MSRLGNLVQKLPYRVRRPVERARHTVIVMSSLNGRNPRICPICGYQGKFRAFGLPPHFDAMCARCDSLDRHRLFVLMDQQHAILAGAKTMLHFAPEKILERRFRKSIPGYRSADLFNREVDIQSCNIENTGLPPASFDVIFASHILEHVDDRQAMNELNRLLVPGGKLIAMVPMIDAWAQTYENDSIVTEHGREMHFGQKDHIRYYGADFVTRLEAAGFDVISYMATAEECVTYSLTRGERVFVARKRET